MADTDKIQISKVIDDFFESLKKKDIKGMMVCYTSDVIVFDVKPPFQTKGAVAWRHTWEASLPYFLDEFTVEMKDLHIHCDSNVGFAHYLFRLVGQEKNHPTLQTWMRTSTGFKKTAGKWKIVHEHGSLPFRPDTLQAMFSLEG